MSVKIMSLIFDSHLERDKRFILLALGDHADHDGRSIYPSVATIARKTGYSERQTQRILAALAVDRILIRDGFGPNGVNRYHIDLHRLAAYRPAITPEDPQPEPQSTGVTPCHPPTPDIGDIIPPQGDIPDPAGVTSTPKRGDIMTPEPSLTKTINRQVKTDSGDILTHPTNFPDDNTSPLDPDLEKIWRSCLSQLRASLSTVNYRKLVQPLELDHNSDPTLLLIRCPNPALAQSRLGATLLRLIAPNFDPPPEIQFIPIPQ